MSGEDLLISKSLGEISYAGGWCLQETSAVHVPATEVYDDAAAQS